MSRGKSKISEDFFQNIYFCNKLKELREWKKLIPAQLEREIGLTRGMWETYESGKSMPGLLAVVKIALYFEKSLDDLVGLSPTTGTKFAPISLEHIIPTPVLSDLATQIKSQLTDVKISDTEMAEIVLCAEIFIHLLANPAERKKNLRRLRRSLEGLEEADLSKENEKL